MLKAVVHILLVYLLAVGVFSCTERHAKGIPYSSSDSTSIKTLLDFSDTCFDVSKAADANRKAGLKITELLNLNVKDPELLRHYARFLNNKGVFLSIFKANGNELTEYVKALEITRVIGDHNQAGSINNNIAYYFLENGEPDIAAEYYNRAIDHLNKNNNKKDLGYLYKSMATIAIQHKQYDEALDFCQKAIQTANASDNDGKELIASCLNNIGGVYMYQKKYPLAMEYFLRSENMLRGQNNMFELISTLQNKGSAYRYMGKNDSAEIFLTQAWQLSDSMAINEQLYKTADALWTFYNTTNQQQKAEAFKKLHGNYIQEQKNLVSNPVPRHITDTSALTKKGKLFSDSLRKAGIIK
ncbi:MAG: tetratricopeptide repeat protein [Sediminibacterium sp.]|nr:tetratricopeptide repeat protein [Sediminibacterium sp.]